MLRQADFLSSLDMVTEIAELARKEGALADGEGPMPASVE